MAVVNFIYTSRQLVIQAITEANKAEFIAQGSGETDLAFSINNYSAELNSVFNRFFTLQSRYEKTLLSPTDTLPAAPPTATCEHEPGEDCMTCAVCGDCSESIDEDDVCSECNIVYPIDMDDQAARIFSLFESKCPECGYKTTITEAGGKAEFHRNFQWSGDHKIVIREDSHVDGWVSFKCQSQHEHYIEHSNGDWQL